MRKTILLILVCSLLLLTVTSCLQNNKTEQTTPQDITDGTTQDNVLDKTTTDEATTTEPLPNESSTIDNNQTTPPPVIDSGEVQDSTDALIVALLTYIEESRYDINPGHTSIAYSINKIKKGKQPILFAADPNEFYFVCGYYPNASDEQSDDLSHYTAEQYVWVKYDTANSICEYHNGGKIAVSFQINKSLTVIDILSKETDVLEFEHFRSYTPIFENGLNVNTHIFFDEAFIYLNDSGKDTVYHSKSSADHSSITIECICLEGEYYIPIHLGTAKSDETVDVLAFLTRQSFIRECGEYYDEILGVIDCEKYSEESKGYTYYYGLISVKDFVGSVLN